MGLLLKLRQAIKICREVYGFSFKQMQDRCAKRRTYKQIQEAKRSCLRRDWLDDRRIPHIPNEKEEYEQAEIFGCLMLDLSEVMGMSKEEIDKQKEKFLIEMAKCKPE